MINKLLTNVIDEIKKANLELEQCKFSTVTCITNMALSYLSFAPCNHCRHTKSKSKKYGTSIAINMQDQSLEIYKITSKERETLRIAITNLGGNFIKQRMPKTGYSLDTFNIPINHIDPKILSMIL